MKEFPGKDADVLDVSSSCESASANEEAFGSAGSPDVKGEVKGVLPERTCELWGERGDVEVLMVLAFEGVDDEDT